MEVYFVFSGNFRKKVDAAMTRALLWLTEPEIQTRSIGSFREMRRFTPLKVFTAGIPTLVELVGGGFLKGLGIYVSTHISLSVYDNFKKLAWELRAAAASEQPGRGVSIVKPTPTESPPEP